MYAMAYTTQFSEWLAAVLFQKGISQSELARQAGVTRGAINGVLTGARGPGVDLCNGIARALKIPPEWILEDEPKIVNGLLTRLFRGIKIMGDGRVIPVLRN